MPTLTPAPSPALTPHAFSLSFSFAAPYDVAVTLHALLLGAAALRDEPPFTDPAIGTDAAYWLTGHAIALAARFADHLDQGA